jgi:hypothetical protein
LIINMDNNFLIDFFNHTYPSDSRFPSLA